MMKYSYIVTALTLLQALNAAAFNPHTDPQNTRGWTLNSSVSDEFNGTSVDTAKWYIQGQNGHYENNFTGRAPSQFVPENVSVNNGFATIATKWEPDFPFLSKKQDGRSYENITTGALISKAQFLHGYMEIRCQAAEGPISSSFWTTGHGGELDVFEHWGQSSTTQASDKRYHTSFHDWRTPRQDTYGKRIWTNEHLLDFSVWDGFHIYGLEWDPDYLKIYVDGKLIRYITRAEIGDDWVVVNKQKVWLDCEVFPWEMNQATVNAGDYPEEGAKFIIDYVRIWQTDSQQSAPQTETNLLSNPSFETGLAEWEVTGDIEVTSDAHIGEHAARLNNPGTLTRTVPVKPNTTYVLSAHVKMPGTGGRNWHHSFLGVKDYGGDEITHRYFHSNYYYRGIQFTTGSTTKTATLFFTNNPTGRPSLVDDFNLYETIDLSVPSS